MVPLRNHLHLSSVLLLFLVQAVAAAAVGGAGPALAAGTLGFLLANWYFTPPLHRWTIAEPQSLIALLVYLVVAGVVSWFVATVARDGFPLPELLARATIVIELVGGICIALGLLSRLWAALITMQFLWIVAQVKWDVGVLGPPGRGGGFELELLYAVTAAAVLVAGPGLLALDHLIGLEADLSQEAAGVRRESRTGAR